MDFGIECIEPPHGRAE